MHPFASYVLRCYYKATAWNEDNLYANLTRSSNAILDFTVPRGLHLTVSKSPNALFKTTYSMTAMPNLNGSIGYIFTSCPLNVGSSGDVKFKDVLERFKVYDQPKRPEAREEEWLAGEKVNKRDYLMYGRLYLPTGRLDALYSTRISPTLQAMVAAISEPPSGAHVDLRGRNDASNVMFNLQHDMGKWCTEYTWSAEDGMWGIRFLHNFGRLGIPNPNDDTGTIDKGSTSAGRSGMKRIDEEDAVEGGLKGRISMGAEIYLSAKERSAGVSTGIRFTTLPDAIPSSTGSASKGPPPQPPTTITALFNPMLGHISSAYTARVSRDLAISSRFDFNMYSYESEWTMGAEWWIRPSTIESDDPELVLPTNVSPQGVVKARASTSNNVSIMWEGRLRNVLVGLGVVSDFASRAKPIKTVGLEVSYFSSE